ncbi:MULTISPECIES: DUF3108 domain-containing protein [Gammaproteobacteria]|uniref:DUF3108 domain-containing protein n=1 Tax=Vreelandella halophila TaxID=86177 RepID=A0A9X4YAF5_9GAMM|nr:MULTISPECIES: DUF3108 domain-containing protein [Gammaproteobacteria]KAA8985268.1 DUF3108 domain-containing protein [Halospina sp. K52047b]MYL25680.1 DUF3108 domain-containing protein [Halomonas utahensis]MYL76045.1 DUF3108 domain-containing protein [Halomonas sp. 22501_18_FS]
MDPIRRLVLTLAAAAVLPSAAFAQDLGLYPMTTTYGAELERGITISGEATRSLEPTDTGRWIYRFDVDSFVADIRESSRFRFEDQTVISERYRYSLEGFFLSNRYKKLDFNWDESVIVDRVNDQRTDMSDHPDVQDQLGAQLQLWVDLRAGRETMEYVIPDEGEFKDYQFEVLREETLDTREFGKVETVVVERVRDEDSPRTTLMWFAPEWDHLLVRLEQTNDEGEDFEIYLKSATLDGERIQP